MRDAGRSVHEMAPTKPARKPRKPPELRLYRVKTPDFYEKSVAVRTAKDAAWALGTSDIEEMVDSKLLKKAKRRPGVVFRKLKGVKRDWEAWE
jgi:hypothetical protein